MTESATVVRGQEDYETIFAIEQMASYALAISLCAGKRVLDISSRNGLGAAWLKACGASYVLGVEASEVAVADAASRFSANGLEFRVGHAISERAWLHPAETFDLIVCHDPIEHEADVGPLPLTLSKVLSPGGVLVISCCRPTINEVRRHAGEIVDDGDRLQEFKQATQKLLGPASQWFSASRSCGIVLTDENDHPITAPPFHPELVIDDASVTGLPKLSGVLSHLEVDGIACCIGVWNARSEPFQFIGSLPDGPLLQVRLAPGGRRSPTTERSTIDLENRLELAEQRAREIRHVTEIEKRYLKDRIVQLSREISVLSKELEEYRTSRAHTLARLYMRAANSQKPILRLLFLPRRLLAALLRQLR